MSMVEVDSVKLTKLMEGYKALKQENEKLKEELKGLEVMKMLYNKVQERK